ncbi:protein of unknown function [Maridesulfovibrio hydrothermalis AM13 = DSM 14728]|uniref:Uncharacterized protein n=1 Tax=Maridesulfovibrio hydrothermalis AM13 = DSM 14728 TaxID=1121451 RepID=L0R750_9BACT|nr:protein of unknown function [Maridesulfovibrio hydrothermalis AM13 = DSM 14728]
MYTVTAYTFLVRQLLLPCSSEAEYFNMALGKAFWRSHKLVCF